MVRLGLAPPIASFHRPLPSMALKVILACLALPLFACGSTDAQLKQASQFLETEEYAQAISLLDELAPKSEDEEYRHHRLFAIAHAGLGHVSESVAHTVAAFELNRRRASTDVINMADLHVFRGQAGQGTRYYEGLRDLLPYPYGRPGLETWRIPFSIGNLACPSSDDLRQGGA